MLIYTGENNMRTSIILAGYLISDSLKTIHSDGYSDTTMLVIAIFVICCVIMDIVDFARSVVGSGH